MILAAKDIQKAFGVDVILEKITFTIEEREKVAIVGVNGAGKTTLFSILCGETSQDSGELFFQKDATIGYLEQNPKLSGKATLYDELLSVFAPLQQIEALLRKMEGEMGHLAGQELADHMEKYSRLQHEFEDKNGYGYESRIRGVLKGLGFPENEYQKDVTTLSGGQKTRLFLGKLLLTQPDVLLLDEPTNHLDIGSIEWLEDFLRSYPGTVLLISHDRYFLDRIVTRVIEIENRKSHVYWGNYSYFAEQKVMNRQIQMKEYLEQQKEIKKQEDIIKTLRSYNREKSVKRAESREKMLAKMDRMDRPEDAPDKMRLELSPKIISGTDVLTAEGLAKGFGDNTLFTGLDFTIQREEKVALIGPNGVGKSTLFKLLLQKLQKDAGYIHLGTNVRIGYYDQEQQFLDPSKTIFQEIADTYPTMEKGQIRNVLAAFVFTGDDVYKPISALSGGEKGRVSLAKIMLSEANFLLLDEPTNHLDMISKEILEDAINRYTGTVFYISHDRYFINRTAKKILELTPNGMNQYWGNYDYYLEKAREAKEEALEKESPSQSAVIEPLTETKQDWLKQKEAQALERKRQGRIDRLEKEIQEKEEAIKELDALLFQDDIAKDPEKANQLFGEKTKLEESIEELYAQWEELQEENN